MDWEDWNGQWVGWRWEQEPGWRYGCGRMATGWTTNVARVSGEEAEAESADNESAVGVQVVAAADLGLELTGEAETAVVLGTERRYGLVVRNEGPSEAGGVVLAGRLGAGLELVSVEWEEGQWSVEEGVVRCELGAMGVSETVEVGLVVLGSEEGEWMNRFEVSGLEADGLAENNVVEWMSAVRKETDWRWG